MSKDRLHPGCPLTVRLASAAALAVCGSGFLSSACAQGLPSTPPTAATQTAAITAAAAQSGSRPRHRAAVTLTGGRLLIRADNSSLNSILRSLSDQTGMKITGGVTDQRVFGTYGPGPADQVLSELLEGTGTNMILRLDPSGQPGELVLSPRLGGPTPPSPSTFRDDAEETQIAAPAPTQPQPQPPTSPSGATQSIVPPLPFSKPALPPAATDPMQTPVTPDPQGIVDPPTVSPATEPGTTPGPTTQQTGLSDTTSGRTSDAPKTPQQIYEELQKLRQQQQPPQN